MAEDSTADMAVEDITEVSWEDLATKMAGPGVLVATAGGCGSSGVGTCVTSYTSTGSCVDEV